MLLSNSPTDHAFQVDRLSHASRLAYFTQTAVPRTPGVAEELSGTMRSDMGPRRWLSAATRVTPTFVTAPNGRLHTTAAPCLLGSGGGLAGCLQWASGRQLSWARWKWPSRASWTAPPPRRHRARTGPASRGGRRYRRGIQKACRPVRTSLALALEVATAFEKD